MKFRDHSVTQVLVGLHRVGMVGLHDALEAADASGLEGREALVDLVARELAANNYVPDGQAEAFRTAVWRELLRHRGQDCSAFFSPVEVTVRGAPGPVRERFVDMLRSALAELELRPVVAFEDPVGEGPSPQLLIRSEVVSRGLPTPQNLRQALRKTLSDW